MTSTCSTWRTVKLKDVAEYVTVGHVGPMRDKYVDSGIPFLRSQNVTPFSLDLTSVKYIDHDFHRKLKKSALQPGDVAIVRTGYPGTAAVIPPNMPVANCADLVIVRPSDQLNPHFLAALLNSELGKGQIVNSLVGVAQQHFNVSVAKEMTFDLPPIEVQDRIASILSAYDDLIENNRRRIEILEEMARNIYREWFVHFRFPGHEDVQLVDSPLGPIPEGWEVKRLGDIATLHRKSITPAKQPEEQFAHYSLPAFDEAQLPIVESGGSIRSNKYLMPDQCVLLAKLNPRIPRVWLVLNGPSEPAIASTEFMVLSPEQPVTLEFLFSHCRSDEFMGTLASVAGGTSTSHQRVKPDHVLSSELVVPDAETMSSFTNAVGPLLRVVVKLRERNKVLSTTRDLLLPKLVAGDITLTELSEGVPVDEYK